MSKQPIKEDFVSREEQAERSARKAGKFQPSVDKLADPTADHEDEPVGDAEDDVAEEDLLNEGDGVEEELEEEGETTED